MCDLRYIHQINGLKNVLASCINAVATVFFIFAGLVVWGDALSLLLRL